MKNILHDTPDSSLSARTEFSKRFCDDDDIVGKAVLDIGCGFGWFERHLAERGVREAVGIEVAEGDLSAARTIADIRVRFTTGSAIELPFEDASFDTVVSWEVLEHIPKGTEGRMFAEVRRVLRPGGVFYFSTPFASIAARVFDPAWWLIGHRHYGIPALTEFAHQGGFTVNRTTVRGGWWEIIGVNDLYVSKWVLRRRPLFEDYVSRLQFEEYERDGGFSTIFMKLIRND